MALRVIKSSLNRIFWLYIPWGGLLITLRFSRSHTHHTDMIMIFQQPNHSQHTSWTTETKTTTVNPPILLIQSLHVILRARKIIVKPLMIYCFLFMNWFPSGMPSNSIMLQKLLSQM
ncbi:hypothetical protein EYC80_002650 [Monilinia laxa]|uniref:Uncharacterized protein n=1 Tax=Monilinia laxa TaxID=61186 RepID=A0A5N6K4J7_MONLA|nr:hypothetical protein EYC80_002650 [Monilinia laxa]